MRRWIIASFTLAALSSGGCRFCQGPDDYCGPVYWNGGPVLGFCERHNSVLSPGTYHIHSDEFVEGETVLETEPSEEIIIDGNDGPVISNEPVLAPAPSSPTRSSSPQQWTPPRKQPSAPTIMAPPAPIRTTRISGE